MPLQNRVDPMGFIHAVEARGLFTGNRGVIHDPATRTLLARRWTSKAWIICACDYKGGWREVMGRNAPKGGAGWTELFFLDEVTALAAGHRPCFTCRRERAKEFVGHFGDAFGIAAPKAPALDARLHRERRASGGDLAGVGKGGLGALPDGAMVSDGDAQYALLGGNALRWSFRGYDRPAPFGSLQAKDIRVVTPPTTLAVLRAGYRPAWHGSAGT